MVCSQLLTTKRLFHVLVCIGMVLFASVTQGGVLGLHSRGFGSSDSVAQKTIELDPVLVSGERSVLLNANVGKTTQIGSDIISQNAARSLADVLAENSLLYIKSLGQGAQATSSFRGTSSSHTQVLWNGININSATLGNFDFSMIPGFFVDELNIFSGVAQMRGGSSIGGSVQLNTRWVPMTQDGSQVLFRGEWGSWNTQTYGLSWKWKQQKWSTQTRVYTQTSDNDFSYENRVLTMHPFEEKRKQAAYEQYGVMQDVSYRVNATDVLSLSLWGQWDQRELPQPITSFNTVDESQKTFHVRNLIKYAMERGRWNSVISLAYLWDKLDYEKKFPTNYGNVRSQNHSDAWMWAWDNSYTFHPQWLLRWSAQYRTDQVRSGSYAHEHAFRGDVQVQSSLGWTPAASWNVDVSAMVESMKSSDKTVQTVPNLSAVVRYQWIPDALGLRVSESLNHRFPTLNDWYWEPGGNPDLLPEKAFTSELGIQVYPHWNKFVPGCSGWRWKTELTVYRMDVRDWIMWVPAGSGYLWEPRNFGRVEALGAEWMSQVKYSSTWMDQSLIFNYAYSTSVDRTQRGSESYGRQLPYIPLNKWNVRYAVDGRFSSSCQNRWGLSRWNAAYGAYFTDARFTSADESYYTPAYCLHDFLLGVEWKRSVKRTPYQLKFQMKINNIWNAYYESTQYYPMPRRNFSFSLSLLCG